MATPSQIGFFQKLTEEREMTGPKGKQLDVKELQEQFAELNDKSASAWIEAALAKPKRDDSQDPITAPPFGA
jgi:hypothetical protein